MTQNMLPLRSMLHHRFSSPKAMITLAVLSTAGLQLALSVVMFLMLGHFLDQRWGCLPWGTIIGTIIGFSGGLYNLLRLLRWLEQHDKNVQRD